MDIVKFTECYETIVEHLAQAAEQIPDDKIQFKPSENSMPWLYLVSHPATHWVVFTRLIDGNPDHGFPEIYRENLASDGKHASEQLRNGWKMFRDYLLSKPETITSYSFTPPWGGPEMTVDAMLDWTWEEGVHHRGQAWVYARMNGIKPPSIWGTGS